jgi:hypothetical protein
MAQMEQDDPLLLVLVTSQERRLRTMAGAAQGLVGTESREAAVEVEEGHAGAAPARSSSFRSLRGGKGALQRIL